MAYASFKGVKKIGIRPTAKGKERDIVRDEVRATRESLNGLGMQSVRLDAFRTPTNTGAYGQVYMFDDVKERFYDAQLLPVFISLRYLVYSGAPSTRSDLAVKIQGRSGGEQFSAWLDGCLSESFIHQLLSEGGSVRIPGFAPLASSDYVPQFYFAGLTRTVQNNSSRFIVAMRKAPGVPLYRLLTMVQPDAEMYVAVERALCSLWLQGVVHSDAHHGNIVYDPETRKATILDFGYAVIVPGLVRDKMIKTIVELLVRERPRSLLVYLWTQELNDYVDRIMRQRRKTYYSPNIRSAMTLYNRLSVKEREKVPNVRYRVWKNGR